MEGFNIDKAVIVSKYSAIIKTLFEETFEEEMNEEEGKAFIAFIDSIVWRARDLSKFDKKIELALQFNDKEK